jgi:hypothetical protein
VALLFEDLLHTVHVASWTASRRTAGEMARAGIEPATPRFSAVCSTN